MIYNILIMETKQLIKCLHPYIYDQKKERLYLYEKIKDQYDNKRQSLESINNDWSILVGCGKCKYCLQKKQSRLSNYVNNQISQSAFNYLITITFDNQHIIKNLKYLNDDPNDLQIKKDLYTSISKRQIQNIIKNWKNKFNRFYKNKVKLNYFLCGEYGSNTKRAHYHIYLGCDMPIPQLVNVKDTHYTSKFIRSKQYGFFDIEKITFNSKNVGFYLTKYLQKQLNNNNSNLNTIKINLDQEIKELKQFGFLLVSQSPFYKKSRGLGLYNDFNLDLQKNNITRYYLQKIINNNINKLVLPFQSDLLNLKYDPNVFTYNKKFIILQKEFNNYYSIFDNSYDYFCSMCFKLKNFGPELMNKINKQFYYSLKKIFPEIYECFIKLWKIKQDHMNKKISYYESNNKKTYQYDLF